MAVARGGMGLEVEDVEVSGASLVEVAVASLVVSSLLAMPVDLQAHSRCRPASTRLVYVRDHSLLISAKRDSKAPASLARLRPRRRTLQHWHVSRLEPLVAWCHQHVQHLSHHFHLVRDL